MEGLIEGRIVHYVPAEHDAWLEKACKEGRHLAAMVVRVWGNGVVNLLVFPDGTNDVPQAERYDSRVISGLWFTSRAHDASGTPGTWHFPERV